MRRLPHLVLALLLVVGLAACGDDGESSDGEDFDAPSDTTGDLPEGAIVFTPDDVERDANGEEVNWTPQAEDVIAAEELLRDHLDQHPELGLDDFDTFHRQYVGIGPDDGQSLSVSALCEAADLDDWEDDYIVVADGGTCFWQAHVFVPAGIVSDVRVNGSA